MSDMTASWLRARFVGAGNPCQTLEALLADLTEDGQATWTMRDNLTEVHFVLSQWVPHHKACKDPVKDRFGGGTSVHSDIEFRLIHTDNGFVPGVVVRCSALYPTAGAMASYDDAYRQLYAQFAAPKPLPGT